MQCLFKCAVICYCSLSYILMSCHLSLLSQQASWCDASSSVQRIVGQNSRRSVLLRNTAENCGQTQQGNPVFLEYFYYLACDIPRQTKAFSGKLNWTAAWDVFLCPDILTAPRIRQMTCEQTRTVNLNINRWCNLVNEISTRGLERVRKEPCR